MYKPLQRKLLLVFVFMVLASCTPAEPKATSTPGFTTVSTSIPPLADEELAEAIHRAQETLHIWRQEFLAPKTSYSMTSLKVRFQSEGAVEDMWTEPVYIYDDLYTVRMVEGVLVEQRGHPDRLVDVQPEDVIDWMILTDDGILLGGYTLRLEYERMTPEQQKRYIEITGIQFDKQK